MKNAILVIIPAFNEERAIAQVVRSIHDQRADVDVVVVNDGSSDGTAKAAGGAGAVVLTHPFNMGYGVSLQTGYKYAVRNGYRFVVQMDGDGQHDVGSMDDLLRIVTGGQADVALGSRFLGKGDYRPSSLRMMGIRLFRTLLRILSGKRIKDVTTGFQAMNGDVLRLFVTDVFPCDYPDADVILLLGMLGFALREVPVVMHPSVSGKSMHRSPFRVLYYIFKMFLSMLLTRIRTYAAPHRTAGEKEG